MSTIFLLAGVVLAGMIVAAAAQVRSVQVRIGAAVLALVVLCAFFTLASFRFVGEDDIGVVTKNIGFKSLPPGKIIATLDPKPGSVYGADAPTYVLPEIQVQKVDGEYIVILNDDQLPHVRISRHYRRILENPETRPEVREYVQERIRSGAFLIKSIHQRQKTINRIATEIVERQN